MAGRDDHRRRHRRAARRCACSATCSAPACISVDHPRFLSASCRPRRPRPSILFDLVVGASSIYAGSWLEGAGAVLRRERGAALDQPIWPACPAAAGGVFVSGGTAGNLSRADRRPRTAGANAAGGALDRTRGLIVASSGAHSQRRRCGDGRWTPTCCRCPPTSSGRLRGDALRRDAWPGSPPTTASGSSPSWPPRGTTNAGVIDDIAGVADVAARAGHVDARRRRLRRRRPGRAERARPVRRHRARRQLHRRSAQVAVRPVRLLRAAVPRPAARRAPRTPSTPSTSTCCTPTTTDDDASGTPATSPITCRGGRGACRSGSAWRRMAPTRIATPSRPRCR